MAVRTIDALSRLEDLTNDPEKLPSPNALLVAIAYERHKQERARIDEALVTGLGQAKQAQLDAMHSRILQLWKADRAAAQMEQPVDRCGSRATGFAQYVDDCRRNRSAHDAAARALVAYDTAQSAGVDEQDASRTGNDLRQQHNLVVSRLNAETWLVVLKPAVDELAAYGEGGIKPETIANVLQALGLVGLGAIRWGVN